MLFPIQKYDVDKPFKIDELIYANEMQINIHVTDALPSYDKSWSINKYTNILWEWSDWLCNVCIECVITGMKTFICINNINARKSSLVCCIVTRNILSL